MPDGDKLSIGQNNESKNITRLVQLPKGPTLSALPPGTFVSGDAAFEVWPSVDKWIGISVQADRGRGIQSSLYGWDDTGQPNDAIRGHAEGGDTGVAGVGRAGVVGESIHEDPGYDGVLVGVLGTSGRDGGVRGVGKGVFDGVVGEAEKGVGTRGQSDKSHGVLGVSREKPGGSFKIAPSAGVRGTSEFGRGVSGFSPGGMGVEGASTSGVGVRARTDSGTALYALATTTGNAAFFKGPIVVAGGGKFAAIPQRDGSYRGLYAVESPDCWFEDFGEARLKRGRARVRLPADFAKLIRGRVRVFLTPEGDCEGLFVERNDASGFTVRELRGGKHSIRFSYRVVGRRRDIPAPRFPKIQVPKWAENAPVDASLDGRPIRESRDSRRTRAPRPSVRRRQRRG
jgi:hypothetical protein